MTDSPCMYCPGLAASRQIDLFTRCSREVCSPAVHNSAVYHNIYLESDAPAAGCLYILYQVL